MTQEQTDLAKVTADESAIKATEATEATEEAQLQTDTAQAVTDAVPPTPPPPVTNALVLNTPTFPLLVNGVPVSPIVLSAIGGTGTGYAYSISGGPTGLAVSGSDITGTPTSAGSFNVGITVHDSGGNADTSTYALTVAQLGAPTIGTPIISSNGNVEFPLSNYAPGSVGLQASIDKSVWQTQTAVPTEWTAAAVPAGNHTASFAGVTANGTVGAEATVSFTIASVVTPPTGNPIPAITSGQLPSGLTVPTNLAMNATFNSTTLAAPFTEGWYGAGTATQNETQMIPANVIPTANGLQLLVTAAGTGGLVTTNSAFNWTSAKPFYAEVGFVPATDAHGDLLNWQELWYTTWGVWVGEMDLFESLGSNGKNGGAAAHVHDNDNAIVPTGIDFNLTAGATNTVGCLQLPNGEHYLFVNGTYKGSMQGAAVAAAVAVGTGGDDTSLFERKRRRLSGEVGASSSVLASNTPWMFVLGNSVTSGEISTAQPATLLVKWARLWQ